MNIFVLEPDPVGAAVAQCDKHVVKMPLESAQMLCTVARQYGFDAPYRPTHSKHPCTLWAGSSVEAFDWLLQHGLALCSEYQTRYGKEHKCQAVLRAVGDTEGLRQSLPQSPMAAFAQAMPDQYRQPDAVQAYRAFYKGEKARFATWRSNPPSWW